MALEREPRPTVDAVLSGSEDDHLESLERFIAWAEKTLDRAALAQLTREEKDKIDKALRRARQERTRLLELQAGIVLEL